MRLILFSHDMEPLTVVDVPADILKGRGPGDHIRLIPRAENVRWEPLAICDLSFSIVYIRLERMHCHHGSILVGFVGDDGLTLKSTLLPGQIADYQWEYA